VSVLLGIAVVAAVGWIAMLLVRQSQDASRAERLADGEQRRGEAIARLVGDRPGGAPDRPLRVGSPAEIEPRVEREPCPWCAGTIRVDAHEVEEHDDRLLRRVVGRCTACGRELVTWFHVQAVLPN
jgi:hypothetical protein